MIDTHEKANKDTLAGKDAPESLLPGLLYPHAKVDSSKYTWAVKWPWSLLLSSVLSLGCAGPLQSFRMPCSPLDFVRMQIYFQ